MRTFSAILHGYLLGTGSNQTLSAIDYLRNKEAIDRLEALVRGLIDEVWR